MLCVMALELHIVSRQDTAHKPTQAYTNTSGTPRISSPEHVTSTKHVSNRRSRVKGQTRHVVDSTVPHS